MTSGRNPAQYFLLRHCPLPRSRCTPHSLLVPSKAVVDVPAKATSRVAAPTAGGGRAIAASVSSRTLRHSLLLLRHSLLLLLGHSLLLLGHTAVAGLRLGSKALLLLLLAAILPSTARRRSRR